MLLTLEGERIFLSVDNISVKSQAIKEYGIFRGLSQSFDLLLPPDIIVHYVTNPTKEVNFCRGLD